MKDKTTPPENLLDARTVGHWLGIAISTVYDHVNRGTLPHVKLWSGERKAVIRFRREDVEEFIRQRSHGGSSADVNTKADSR